jgi:chemotaxis family two-component system response regulator Rcp1
MSLPTRILLVEDNPVDVRMILFALEEQTSWNTQTTVVEDGESATQFLLESTNELDLVILDLNLPKRDGTEVLRAIRSTPRLASMAVIVLSSLPETVSESLVTALHLHADAYLRKPVGANEFQQLGEWLRESYRRAAPGRPGAERSRHAG